MLLGFLPPEIAIPAASILSIDPAILYQAVVQDGQRRYEEFKKNYGDSEESSHLYQQGQKAADDWYNGFTPWD